MRRLSKILICILIVILVSRISAQEINWAYQVFDFSSQLSEVQYSARQVLGEPNVMPGYGLSPCAWSPKIQNNAREEWIVVAFEKPAYVSQIVILESFNPGTTSKIFFYDSLGHKHYVYNKVQKENVGKRGRVKRIFIPKTDYRVQLARIYFKTNSVPGWNQIDAIGISESDKPYRLKINTSGESLFQSKPQNLGKNVNSPYKELGPVISPDGKTLYFTRDGHPENIGPEKRQDLWFSIKQGKNSFTPAKNVSYPINNEANNFAFSITPDGNSILLGNVYKKDSIREKGVSISYYNGEEWSYPDKLNIKDYYNINRLTAFCLGNDSKTLIQASERKNSYGSTDLYVSFLQSDNQWSEPRNLGPDINTADDEQAPFLASDGVTLYFSSGGHPGYGQKDIFITRRLDDSWTKWSKPENLGPKINTEGWDAFFTIPASGDYAYYVSTKRSYGKEDIFRIELPHYLRPNPVALISGKVLNSKTGKPVSAKILYETLPEGIQIGQARSNPKTGLYRIVLPAGKIYGFLADAHGYLSINENLDLTKFDKYKEITKDLFLVPIEHGQSVKLNNIFFEFGKYELLKASFAELNRVADFLLDRKEIKIEIHGHTCNIGTNESNFDLSQNRAQAVAAYLKSRGIAANRIKIKGYGQSKPLFPNTSERNREKNRRVEFIIISK